MSDIFVPASLSHADIALGLANSLAKILDPAERAKIADDIKQHHTLNDAQAKKHADAIALINQHQSILDETLRVSDKNQKDKDKLSEDRVKFDIEIEEARKKIAEETKGLQTELAKTKKLQEEILFEKNTYADREGELKKNIETHKKNVEKLEEDKRTLTKKLEEVEEIKRQQTETLENVKSTQAAIAALVIKK